MARIKRGARIMPTLQFGQRQASEKIQIRRLIARGASQPCSIFILSSVKRFLSRGESCRIGRKFLRSCSGRRPFTLSLEGFTRSVEGWWALFPGEKRSERKKLWRRRICRHREQHPVSGGFPFFLEFRALDSQKFAARRIVHKHSFALPIHSGDDHIV